MTRVDQGADFGVRMRLVREARGVTLRDVAAATNLSIAQLEALERNDIPFLPGGIFLRGIVRSYARQIGLDPEATLLEFISSQPPDSAVTGTPQVYQSDYERATTSSGHGGLVLIVAVVAVLVMSIIVWLLAR